MANEVGVITSALIICTIISYTATVVSNWFAPVFALIPSYTLGWSSTPEEIFTDADKQNVALNFFGYYVWNVLTYVITEETFLIGISFILIVFFVGSQVEKALGTRPFAVMVIIVTLFTGVITTIWARLLSFLNLTSSSQRMYCGMWPVVQAVLICFVKIKGANTSVSSLITITNNNKVKRWLNKLSMIKTIHLPQAILLLALIIDLKRIVTHEMTYDLATTTTTKPPEVQGKFQAQNKLGIIEIRSFGSVFVLALLGMWLSWLYLLFTRASNFNYAFDNFFYPHPVRKYMGKFSAISRFVANKTFVPLMRHLGQSKEFDALINDQLDDVSGNENEHEYNTGNLTKKSKKTDIEVKANVTYSEQTILPAPLYSKKTPSNDVDAERHRAIAIAALNRRMQEQQTEHKSQEEEQNPIINK